MKKITALVVVMMVVVMLGMGARVSAGQVKLKLDSGKPIGHILTSCCEEIAKRINEESKGEIQVTYSRRLARRGG